jgi:hypothetical protein
MQHLTVPVPARAAAAVTAGVPPRRRLRLVMPGAVTAGRKPIIFRCVSRSSSYSMPWRTANAYQVMWSLDAGYPAGPACQGEDGE